MSLGYWCCYITFGPEGKFYVGKGKTSSVVRGKYKGSGLRIRRAIAKHGKDAFTAGLLSTHETEEEAYAMEAFFVNADMLDDPRCLNIYVGGNGPGRRPMSEEDKKKISLRFKGKKKSEEHKRRISQGTKGRIITQEQRDKISKTKKGVPFPEIGKQRLSLANIGRKHTEEMKRAMSAKVTGRKRLYLDDGSWTWHYPS